MPRSSNLWATSFSCRARVCTAYQVSISLAAPGTNCGPAHDSTKVAIASPSKSPFPGAPIFLSKEIPRGLRFEVPLGERNSSRTRGRAFSTLGAQKLHTILQDPRSTVSSRGPLSRLLGHSYGMGPQEKTLLAFERHE